MHKVKYCAHKLVVGVDPSEPKKASEEEDDDDVLNQAWALCKKQSKSVEVFYRNMDNEKVLTKIHFQFNPDVSFSSHTLTV